MYVHVAVGYVLRDRRHVHALQHRTKRLNRNELEHIYVPCVELFQKPRPTAGRYIVFRTWRMRLPPEGWKQGRDTDYLFCSLANSIEGRPHTRGSLRFWSKSSAYVSSQDVRRMGVCRDDVFISLPTCCCPRPRRCPCHRRWRRWSGWCCWWWHHVDSLPLTVPLSLSSSLAAFVAGWWWWWCCSSC